MSDYFKKGEDIEYVVHREQPHTWIKGRFIDYIADGRIFFRNANGWPTTIEPEYVRKPLSQSTLEKNNPNRTFKNKN